MINQYILRIFLQLLGKYFHSISNDERCSTRRNESYVIVKVSTDNKQLKFYYKKKLANLS